MKLYRPVLIESAEQAEALPVGTVTLPPARHRGNAVATVKGRDELWRETGSEQPFTDVEMVDEIALVPIEAEEETRVTPEALTAAAQQTLARANRAAATGILPPDRLTIQQQTRYVTPWRDAQ